MKHTNIILTDGSCIVVEESSIEVIQMIRYTSDFIQLVKAKQPNKNVVVSVSHIMCLHEVEVEEGE